MGVIRNAAVCGAAVLALAACDRRGEEADKAAPGAPQAQAPGKAPPPIDAPARKPGLWEQSVSLAGVDFVQTTRVCLDKETDLKLSWWGNQAARSTCAKNLVTRQADGAWRFSSVCDMGSGGVTTTSGTATGDFSTRYQVQAESSTEGAAAPQMNGVRIVNIAARHLGACPEGMKPGDMELPGGQRINMLDMQAPPAG